MPLSPAHLSHGGNASYIDNLYARYERDSKAVDAAWILLPEPERRAWGRRAKCARSVVAPTGLAAAERNDLIGALDGDWQQTGAAIGGKRQEQAQARGVDVTAAEVERATRDFNPGTDADPRLSGARPFPRQSRPARARSAEERGRTRSALLRLGEGDLDRRIFLDKVLGLEFGTVREIVSILRRTYL